MEEIVFEVGTAVYVPPKAVHQLINDGTEVLKAVSAVRRPLSRPSIAEITFVRTRSQGSSRKFAGGSFCLVGGGRMRLQGRVALVTGAGEAWSGIRPGLCSGGRASRCVT